ncbi:MAG: AraC family transcriptional regulator, partial [Holdemania filiformis]
MEWIDRLNASLNYIEEHLTEEIRIEELARIACCSSYHYQRMFTYIAGLPLSEYLRRRRMSIAAVELQQSEIKVIDLALK